MSTKQEMAHYSADFVASGGHRAVAEALNEGQCPALRRVVDATLGERSDVLYLPLHVFAVRQGTKWNVTSLRSRSRWEADVHTLVRRRSLREALLTHGGAEVERVHRAVAHETAHSVVVVRLVVVFADESSHVNAFLVRRGAPTELFEPKMTTHDTPARPFGAVRTAVAEQLCKPHGLIAPMASTSKDLVLQTTDDLCQTWVAMYVVERLRCPSRSFGDVLRLLSAAPPCDRLCAVLQFSHHVYTDVPFPRTTRRGTSVETLSKRRATTSRGFFADPRPCGSTS